MKDLGAAVCSTVKALIPLMDILKPLFNGGKQGGGQQHLKHHTLLKMCLFILYGLFKLPSFKALYYPQLYVVVLAERLAGGVSFFRHLQDRIGPADVDTSL